MLWGACLKIVTARKYCKITIEKSPLKTFIMSFYAVAKGRTPGIFMTWPDCQTQVKGFSGARYKKFNNINEAQNFINDHSGAVSNKFIKTSNSTNLPIKPDNLKRPYSTSTKNENQKNNTKATQKKHTNTSNNSDFEESTEDLDEILNKQMDDIEKRIKGVEKNVNKIIKKSSSKRTILMDPSQPKKKRKDGKDQKGFEVDERGFVQVYTDGACSANGTAGAKAGLGVYWGEGHPLNISEPVSGRATNNCGEIQAATRAIEVALQNGVTHLSINTDSKFLINSITKWIPGWKRKGWKLKSGEPVKNEVDFKELDDLQNQLTVKWNYVEAHKGIHGNEMADKLAKDGAARYNYN